MFANKPGELPAVPGIPMTIIDSLLPGQDLDVRLLDRIGNICKTKWCKKSPAQGHSPHLNPDCLSRPQNFNTQR